MGQKLSHHIAWVLFSIHVEHLRDTSCNGFSAPMIREHVPLSKHRMRCCRTCDDTLVVTKHAGRTADRHTHHVQHVTDVDHLFGSNELRSVCGSLNCRLSLRAPVGRSLINHMQNTCAGPSSCQVMHEICIPKASQTNGGLALRLRHVTWNFFLNISVDGIFP
jgi:hypothetical protein